MFNKNKKAYTLIEMMVVMGIMALLAIVGASAMVGANDANVSEEVAQNILSSVREAQTKAISVTPDHNNNTTKVWSLGISHNGTNPYYQLVSLYSTNGTAINASYNESAQNVVRAGVTISILWADGSTYPITAAANKVYFSYSTPFARPYITRTSNYVSGTSPCAWALSGRPELDFTIGTTCTNVVNSTSNGIVSIDIRYKNKNPRSVKIRSNGDAYIE